MANPKFIMLINAIQDDEERHNLTVFRRNLRDKSDPLSLPENIFRGFYRLSREIAHNLILTIGPYMEDSEREAISIPKQLKIFIALNFYAQGSYQKAVGLDHHIGMSQPSVSRCIQNVTNAINDHMHNEIKFPVNEEEQNLVKQEFMNMPMGFPGIIGAIDCTHVAIVAPPVDNVEFPAIVFLNRKGFYSINVQIVCSATLKILAINARYPGSVHDSAIWQTSQIKQQLIRNFNNGNRNSWLIGDSGYPLEPWLMTPVLGVQQEQERRYNIAHRSTRNVIERLNGVLKTRFRCLLKHRALHYNPVQAGRIINACAILHNYCIDRNDFNVNQIDIDENEEEDNQNYLNNRNNFLRDGRNARNRLINNYF